jgi:glycosyltransferase involved in cell wall biosynthesis
MLRSDAMSDARAITMVSIVLETDSVHASDDVSIDECLDALARQDYPRELIELVVVDGGKVPGLAARVGRRFASAVMLDCPGGTKFEQKNLGCRTARGDLIALIDADCAAPPDWISTIVRELGSASPDVAGIQGVTDLSRGFLSREVSAVLYGVRRLRDGRSAARLVTDNVAFRRDVIRRFAIEHPAFNTVVDSLLHQRITQAGYRILLCERLRMVHSYPPTLWATAAWFFYRAWAVGYFMLRTRQLEPDFRGSALVRAGGLGWPLLALAKTVRDVSQLWQARRRVGARFPAALPLVLAFDTALFLGGLAALLKLPAPRVS